MPQDPDHSNDPGRPRKGELKPTTVSSFIFWTILLFAVPIGLFALSRSKEGTIKELKQSEFEQALVDREVDDVLIKTQSGSAIARISGSYLDRTDNQYQRFEAKAVVTEELIQMIRENCNTWASEPGDSLWASVLLSIVPFLLLIILIYVLFARQIRNAGKGAMQFGKSRARMNQSLEKITFKDVAGVDEAKEEVEEIIDYLRDSEKFRRLGGHIPRGVLMIGPPGTGKTLLARAIAGEADVPFFNISGSDFVEMFVGVGASRVRDMFEQAKKEAPCIIFIDEIDAVGRSRFSGMGGGHDEREQTLNALLVEMDGFEGDSGVIVMAATNRADVLDPALLRPGRFDRQITVDLPDVKGRQGILKVHTKKVKLQENIELNVIARGTPGFSGADLANLVNEAALLAARKGKASIELSDMEEARDKVAFGKERRTRVVSEKDRQVTAYHEAGHALCVLYCEHSTPLHKVTIIPRGNALGLVMSLPSHDQYTKTRDEFMDELTVCMGGRFAEKIIFGEITSGAAMDIKQASAIARNMVCHWGMSDRMGMLTYGGTSNEPIYVARDVSRGDSVSSETAREIDLEVRRIIDESAEKAEEILTTHKDQLILLGKTLLERETMSAVEVKRLLGMDIADENDAFAEARSELDSENSEQPPSEEGVAEEADGEDEATAPDPSGPLLGDDPAPA
jgi:cell division protease FtsH